MVPHACGQLRRRCLARAGGTFSNAFSPQTMNSHIKISQHIDNNAFMYFLRTRFTGVLPCGRVVGGVSCVLDAAGGALSVAVATKSFVAVNNFASFRLP